ncbi:hypothetical protein NMG60_11005645 [Bertholletia excelsa]
MNTLESPLEALALDNLSFGFFTIVNNVWTWVAVVTAAVSFWRLKSIGAGARELKSEGSSENPAGSNLDPAPAPDPAIPAPMPAVSTLETTMATTRGKFTLYYEDEEGDERGSAVAAGERDCGRGSGGWVGEVVSRGGGWCEGWEVMLRTRKGETGSGWYRWQDVTVLDGSVVRLWDGETRWRSAVSVSGGDRW